MIASHTTQIQGLHDRSSVTMDSDLDADLTVTMVAANEDTVMQGTPLASIASVDNRVPEFEVAAYCHIP